MRKRLDTLTPAEYNIDERNEAFTIDDLGNRDTVILQYDSSVDHAIDANTKRHSQIGRAVQTLSAPRDRKMYGTLTPPHSSNS
jgi:hypothetical protein